jgi:hypothetical protein
MAVKLQVADGTQVNMDGHVYGPGETFEASWDEAELLLKAGYAKKVASKKMPPSKNKSSR